MLLSISDLHIKLDLDLQQLGSNRFGMLDGYAKDMYINQAIEGILADYYKVLIGGAKALDGSVIEDIRNNYSVLGKFYETNTTYYPVLNGNKYSIPLPESVHASPTVSSGLLYKGISYYVATAGTTNLTAFGYKTVPIQGEVFDCTFADINPTTAGLQIGGIYRIINSGSTSFLSIGSASNNVGTVFTSTATSMAPADTDCKLEVLALAPTWASTILTANSDLGCYQYIISKAAVDFKYNITKGSVKATRMYRIVKSGTTSWTTIFGYDKIRDNDIHIATTTATPLWTTQAKLIEVRFNPIRLVMPEHEAVLEYPYGSIVTSPIAKLYNDTLIIPVKDYAIHAVELTYLRKPVKVDHTIPMVLNFDESFHNLIIFRAAKLIASVTVNPNYPTLNNEAKDGK